MSTRVEREVAFRTGFRVGPMLGYLALVLGAFLLGTISPTARYVMDRGISFLDLSAARAWTAPIVLGASLIVTRLRTGRNHTIGADRSRAVTPWLIVAFGILLTTTNTLSGYTVGHLPVGIAVVLGYLAP